MQQSTHRVEIVPVELKPHPNADTLSIIPVYGYTYVGKTDVWQGRRRAAYIPPDSVVDVTRPEFSDLADQAKGDGKARIKAKKLRGVLSFGYLAAVPDDTPLGEDWTERLGVTHYEPELNAGGGKGGFFTGGEVASPPEVYAVKYDVDAFRRYHHLFTPGEPVVVTEKLDGANSRFVYADGRMHCGSRTEWKKQFASYEHLTFEGLVAKGVDEAKAKDIVERKRSLPPKTNIWWEVLERTPAIEAFCRAHPGWVLYGEVYGNVNCVKYGLPANQFAAFDVLADGRWLDFVLARSLLHEVGVSTVPHIDMYGSPVQAGVSAMPYDFDRICELAEGTTLVAGAANGVIREGIVVKPIMERWDDRAGRVCFKCVSGVYLERFR